MREQKLYPRKCSITGEGMNEGYVIQDGDMYIKNQIDLINHLRKVEIEGNPLYKEQNTSIEFLLSDYYDAGYYYWTEWEELDEDLNYTSDGKEIITNN